ncbi:MAG: flavodoxin family protein [Desulfovibrionaceae bacterium]
MYAVAINGSPRKNGNTQLLLEKVLEPLRVAGWDTEMVQVGNQKIQGCRACLICAAQHLQCCAYSNDPFNELFAKMLRADALILGSPCYFTDISAELKAVIDRAGLIAFANGGLFKGKIGAAVVAARRGGATHAFDTINHMFQMSQMILPGSTYWNMGYGLDTAEVLKDTEALANMQHLGKMIAWLGAAIAPCKGTLPV